MQPLLPPNKIPDLVFGGAGVFVLLLLQGRVSILSAFVMLAGGMICAYVFPDMLMHFFSANDVYRNGVAFGCGLLGMQFCAAAVGLSAQIRKDPISVLERFPLMRFLSGKEGKDALRPSGSSDGDMDG